ncbi:hypothetical protein ACOME3_001408 [Neoechinorhynchus agilis]
MKLFKIQIDNQLDGSVFPVVLHSIPPPRTMAEPYADRAMIDCLLSFEMQSGQYCSTNSFFRITQFAFLMQEFAIKCDQGFIAHSLRFLSAIGNSPTTDSLESSMKTDLAYCTQSLSSIVESGEGLVGRETDKSLFFKECCIAPLKIHVSFSMQSVSDSQDLLSKYPAVAFFLQTLNIAEVDDVILELKSYQLTNYFATFSLFLSGIMEHYKMQAIKQFYVFVLGLDVLGNPYGLIREVTEGFESVFYEPYMGAILGPTEFFEGLAIGIQGLFSGIVGGTSGAISKITGSLGKGLAHLTFDDQYKRERLLHLQQNDQTVRQSMVQGGKWMFSDFYDGVTGVIRKPIEGAFEDGTHGFLKGLGKGMISAVARPMSGLVGMAQTSFRGVRRLADDKDKVIGRVRPSRFIDFDGIVRPYRKHEADGHNILKRLNGGSYGRSHNYVAHLICTKPSDRPRQYVLATNKGILMITELTVLAQLNVEWYKDYGELVHCPFVTLKKDKTLVILITTQEKKGKFLGSKTTYGVEVNCSDFKEDAEWLCGRISDVLEDEGFRLLKEWE